jgi:lysophospholipase L1-like esterase
MVQGPGPREPQHGHAHGPEHADDAHGLAAAALAIGRSARHRRLRAGFLVALFTVALATLGAEALLRLAHERERSLERNVTRTNRRWLALSRAGLFAEQPDPVRRYGLRPGAEAEIDGLRFRVSSRGSRGPEVASPKPAGERRLLCLGDSFAFGLWCDQEETLAARLVEHARAREAELESGLVWRALDLGVPGYHLGQTLRAFEQEGLALEPDLVLLYFNTNDIEQSGFYLDAELGVLRRDFLPLPVALKRALWRWSHLYGWISSRHARAAEEGEKPFLEPRVPWAHVREDNQAYARAALTRLRSLCRERSLPLFVVNQPLMTFLGEARSSDWPVLALDRWFRGVCAELELPALHLLGWLRGYTDGVDRFAEGAAPDFLPDQYIADERLQEALTWARERAREAGKSWDELALPEQLSFFSGFPFELPADPDFHLTGAAYAHIARLVYERLQAEGWLP